MKNDIWISFCYLIQYHTVMLLHDIILNKTWDLTSSYWWEGIFEKDVPCCQKARSFVLTKLQKKKNKTTKPKNLQKIQSKKVGTAKGRREQYNNMYFLGGMDYLWHAKSKLGDFYIDLHYLKLVRYEFFSHIIQCKGCKICF